MNAREEKLFFYINRTYVWGEITKREDRKGEMYKLVYQLFCLDRTEYRETLKEKQKAANQMKLGKEKRRCKKGRILNT